MLKARITSLFSSLLCRQGSHNGLLLTLWIPLLMFNLIWGPFIEVPSIRWDAKMNLGLLSSVGHLIARCKVGVCENPPLLWSIFTPKDYLYMVLQNLAVHKTPVTFPKLQMELLQSASLNIENLTNISYLSSCTLFGIDIVRHHWNTCTHFETAFLYSFNYIILIYSFRNPLQQISHHWYQAYWPVVLWRALSILLE